MPRQRNGERDGFTAVAPVRKVPGIGKTAALPGFDLLNDAINAVEENAFVVGLFDQ